MVAATPTPGYGCSGRSHDASEISFGVQRTSPLFYKATCRLVPKRGYVRALQTFDNARRAETQARSLRYLCSASAEAKTCREAIRVPS